MGVALGNIFTGVFSVRGFLSIMCSFSINQWHRLPTNCGPHYTRQERPNMIDFGECPWMKNLALKSIDRTQISVILGVNRGGVALLRSS